jgi:serine/threonine protein kinase
MSYCLNQNCAKPDNPDHYQFCQNCGKSLSLNLSDIQQKQVVYRASQVIGQGGFGRTLLAKDDQQKLCVIKQLFPSQHRQNISKNQELFTTEAEQLAKLGKHPQIPHLLAFGEYDGDNYLIQQYIPGPNLAQLLEKKGMFQETQIRQLLNDLLPVLQYVHKSQVIHRDIKPENIIKRKLLPSDYQVAIVDEQNHNLNNSLDSPLDNINEEWQSKGKIGQLFLVDFGAAKRVENRGLVKTGTVIGSAAYIAPEQLMGKAIYASDIYSLGVTCIHLLTHVSPFDLFDSMEGSWVWRDYLRTPISDELTVILDKMLAIAPKNRYQSVTAILRDLNPKTDEYMQNLHYTFHQPKNQENTDSSEPNTGNNSGNTFAKLVKIPEHIAEQQAKVKQELQELLASHPVKIQTQIVNKKLIIILSRDAEAKVKYHELLPVISLKLTQLQLNNIYYVEILGKIQGKTDIEWQKKLAIDYQAKLQNKILRVKLNFRDICTELTSKDFWLARCRDESFWLDLLTWSAMSFIFTQHLIVLYPFLGFVVSSGFVFVKNYFKNIYKDTEKYIREDYLFYCVGILVMIAALDVRIVLRGQFGLLLGGFFIALPLLFVRENSD